MVRQIKNLNSAPELEAIARSTTDALIAIDQADKLYAKEMLEKAMTHLGLEKEES